MHKHNGNTRLPTLCAGKAPVEINESWPNVYVHSSLAGVWKNAWQYIPPMIHYLNTKKHIPSHSYAQDVEASTYNRLTQTSQKIMQISREIRGEWLPNLHHLATYQLVHCRRPSDRTFPPPHSGTCTCSRSPTEPPPTHHLVLPPPPSQHGPLLRPDPPTTSSGHEQYVNYWSLTLFAVVWWTGKCFSATSAGIPQSPPPLLSFAKLWTLNFVNARVSSLEIPLACHRASWWRCRRVCVLFVAQTGLGGIRTEGRATLVRWWTHSR